MSLSFLLARMCISPARVVTTSVSQPQPLSMVVAAVSNTLLSPRWIASATVPLQMPLDEFRDVVSREKRMQEPVGRSWTVRELRRKSYDDMHQLWYVLYKEKNMLLTERNLSRRKGIVFPQPERWKKVKRSMAAIKVVLGERKREKLTERAIRMS